MLSFTVSCMYEINCNNIGRILRGDWARVSAARSSRDSLRLWAQTEPALADFDSLDEVVAAIEGSVLERSIEITQAVTRLAKTEELAHRLLLQVMVPTIATECHRSMRVLYQIHIQDQSTVRPTGADVVDLVLGCAAEAVACYGGRTLAYPLRTIRRRFIEILIHRRSSRIRAETLGVSLAGLQPGGSFARERVRVDAGGERGDSCLVAPEPDAGAAEILAETLQVAVDLGIVSSADAGLVWATRYHQQTSLDLGGGDRREAERLRRRRSRAQQRLVAHADELRAAVLAG